MAVITISRTLGSLGDEVALSLCRELGYQLFDKRWITQAAEDAGETLKEVEELSEDTYKVRSFLDRLFGRSSFMPYLGMWPEDLAAVYAVQGKYLNEEELIGFVQEAVRWAYQLDRMVIVGRGSQVLLREHADVLHVRLDAPQEIRIQRVIEQLRQAEPEQEPEAVARALIYARDSASAEYIKRFYQVNWADPALYHVMFNTGSLQIAQVVPLIVDMVSELPTLPRDVEPVDFSLAG
jgi:CMP/dCMP kinase